MKKLVRPSVVKGIVAAPASKSMMQRAIAIAALANGTSILENYTPCNDSDAALEIARDLGSTVKVEGTVVTITGRTGQCKSDLMCGEAGLGIRMFTPIASLWDKQITLHGEGSLKKRPLDMLEAPLTQLGVRISTTGGFVPLSVCGPLRGGKATVDGSISSQMLTGLLVALPLAKNNTVITVDELKSKPYIDMTLQILSDFGVEVKNDNYQTFTIKANQSYVPTHYSVEGDWSGASFLLVAAALGGKVEVTNLLTNSKQADMQIIKALNDAGAIITSSDNSVTCEKAKLQAYEFDATECPDLFPPLVALASHCKGVTKIKGVSRLKHKESDRASVLKNEFEKIGTNISIDGDYMYVTGGTVTGGTLHANNDHRIAMAAAVAALSSQNPIEIENAECIAKSYPGFYNDLLALGVRCE